MVTNEDLGIRVVRNAIVTAASFQGRRFVGAVYGRDGIVPESRRESVGVMYSPADADSPPAEGPLPRLEGTYLYAGWLHFHFGHFLLESTSRLWATGWLDDRVRLIYHPWDGVDVARLDDNDHIPTTLTALGIQRDRVNTILHDSVVETLIVPQPAVRINNSVHAEMNVLFDKIRLHVVDAASIAEEPAYRGVYLSRRMLPSDARRYANEEVIEDVFRDFGFHIAYPERLTFNEQVELVATADVLAGIDGSALHLVALARPGITVIVVRARQTALTNHWALNQLRGARTIVVDASVDAGAINVDVATLEASLTRVTRSARHV